MKIKYKLIAMFIVIILFALLPVSLFIVQNQKKEKIEAAARQGTIFSKIIAESVLKIVLANGGDIKATQADTKEMMSILKTLTGEGLLYSDAILISSKAEYNGLVLAFFHNDKYEAARNAYGSRLSGDEVRGLIQQKEMREIEIPGIKDICYEFAASASPPGKPPLCIGRLVFSKSVILAPLQRLNRFIYWVTAIAIGIVSLMGLLLSRFISEPIDTLTAATRRIQNGDLNYHIDIQSRDEIGELSSTFNHMVQMINQKIAELERTNVRLTQLDILKDEFLANISHELRTPLSGIIGISESLIKGAAGTLNEDAIRNLSLVVTSGRRLTGLVNDILDFSKLKHHDIMLNYEPVNMHDVVQLIISITRPLFEKKSIKIINMIEPKGVIVYGDENRIEQVMLNLIGNAVKFTEKGSVTVTARDYGEDGRQVAVTVSDTGIGIEPERLDRIFESFEQADGSIIRTHGGTGLGLAITRQLVELQGGLIWAESEPGKGSSFTFTLTKSLKSRKRPAREGEFIKQAAGQYSVPGNVVMKGLLSGRLAESVRKKIMVVDDEPVNLQVIINHLTLEGYEVITAESGSGLFDALDAGDVPDLVLLDIMLPRISGFDICRKVREKFSPHELPIVMLTAKNKTGDIVTGLAAGANDYLPKPVNRDELVARIRSLISMKESADMKSRFNLIQSELGIAREIQMSLIPRGLPEISNIRFGVRYEPSAQVGGDFYDYHIVSDRRIGFLVADVAGHGIPAAMIAAMLQVAYTFYKNESVEPPVLFKKINSVMEQYPHGLYLTACCVFIDLDEMKMYHANAGHRPLIIWRASENRIISDKIYDTPLGIFPNSTYSMNEIEIRDRDRIILFTDGIVEARNQNRRLFGEERLHDVIRDHHDMIPERLVGKVLDTVREWTGIASGESLEDDVTIIVMDIIMAPGPS
ncbi:MAG: SpoIIE family protein phosphatase [Spirochaetes bacterium]|nr:SpoIIE family protein phosphatase [Spirochaetota bacterium]